MTSINIPSNIVHVGEEAFYNCQELKSLYNYLYDKIIFGKATFKECNKLENVNIQATVCCIETKTFYGCVLLGNLNLETEECYIGDCAFGECKKLTRIYNYQFKGVVSIGKEAFSGCSRLEYIYLGDTLKTIEREAFDGCRWNCDIIAGTGLKFISYDILGEDTGGADLNLNENDWIMAWQQYCNENWNLKKMEDVEYCSANYYCYKI